MKSNAIYATNPRNLYAINNILSVTIKRVFVCLSLVYVCNYSFVTLGYTSYATKLLKYQNTCVKYLLIYNEQLLSLCYLLAQIQYTFN